MILFFGGVDRSHTLCAISGHETVWSETDYGGRVEIAIKIYFRMTFNHYKMNSLIFDRYEKRHSDFLLRVALH